jgi:methyl-accepting chemotaxis protein
MIALSQKKLEMLIELKKYSENQYEAFKSGDLDSVENILNKKDELIQYIQKLDDAFLMSSDNLKKLLGITTLEELSKTSLSVRDQLKKQIESITEIVDSIITLEKSSYENASVIKNELKDRIKNVYTGKKMTSAYHTKPVSNPAYFFDKKK